MDYVPFQSEPISSILFSGTYPNEIRTFTTYLLPYAQDVGNKAYPGLYATEYHQWGKVDWCSITPLVTRWRVAEKTITDLVSGNETTYTYEYEGGAVNNNDGASANSAILDTPLIDGILRILTKEYSEFRGHEKTTLFDPQRQTKTVTFYKQDDILAGHAWKIEQWDTSVTPNRQISLQLINYETETLTGPNDITACSYSHIDGKTDTCNVDEITYYKVQTSSTESRVYDNDGVNYMGLKRAYGYDSYGNVIHTTISVWNGNTWEAKQYQENGYEANVDITNNKNLVSLPTYTALYTCPGGNCSNNITNLLKFTCTMYNPAAGSASLCGINSDGSVTEIKPSNAIPIGSRSLLEFVNDLYTNPSYQDTVLTYDDWGNVETSTSYSGVGTSTSIATSEARTVVYAYDPVFHKRIIRRTDPLDGIVNALSVYQYNPAHNCFWFGKPSAIIDPNGQMTTATCDEFGRLTEVRQPGDESGQATTTVEYYPYQSETDPTNITITQKIDQSQSQSTKYIANGLGQIIQTQQLDALVEGGVHKDLVQTVVYDSLGRQVATEVGTHMLTSGMGYDGNFPPYFIETEYDQQDRVIQTTQADGTFTTNAYEIIYFDTSDLLEDQYVLKQTTTDPNGHAQYQYTNVLGQLIEADSNLDDLRIQYEYDQSGNLNKVYQPNKADPAGIQDWNVTEIFYDLVGRKTSMDDVDMGYWEYGYDAIGNLVTQTDARNVTSTITYDLANRNTGKSFSSQSGVSTTTAITKDYDGTSILEQFSGSSLPGIFATSGSPNISVTGGVMIFTGNGTWDLVIRSGASISDGESVSFVFKKNSNNGQTNAFIDTGTYGQANYRRYSFEILNGNFQRSTYTGITVNTTSLMAFNPNIWYMGMLTVGQTGKFQVKIWERDNPAVMAVYSDSFDSSWQNLNWTMRIQNTQDELQIDNYREHDRMGYRSSMTDGSGNTSWLYDYRGKVVKEIKTISGQGSFMTQWVYNSAGLPVSMTYPGGNSGQAGEVLNYTYNKRMLLETMIGNTNYITGSQYDSAGRLLERYLNNGTLKTVRNYYDWDSYGGRLSTIQSGTISTPTSIQNLIYSEYDNNGNIKRLDNPYEKNQSGTQVSAKTYYNYDELNRLVDAQMKNPVGSLTYYQQSYGYDELGRLETKAGTTLAYDEPNYKLHAVSSAGTIDYQYDANGNMILRDTGTANTTYSFTYDSENRLVLATSSTTTVTFTYDGDGNRVKTIQTASGITTTTNLIGRIYEWVSSSNQKRYYYAGSERIALGTSTNSITYIFSDHLGSAVAIRNPLGSIYRIGYYPFGEERFVNNSTPYQFTGQRKEAAIGLYDYQARFYDSSLGRFVQADTIVPQPGNAQAWDRYTYVNNNPIRYNDPSGHDVDCGIGERCRFSSKNEFSKAINRFYDIRIQKPSIFSKDEIRTIYNALGEMETGLNRITNNSGLEWIQKNLGGSSITIQRNIREMIFSGSHVEGNTIYLPKNFTAFSWGNSLDLTIRSMIIHEFSHVFDNRMQSSFGDATILGGGAGDALMNFIGGRSTNFLGLRFFGGIDVPDGYWFPPNDSKSGSGYGNSSVADYFAHAFTAVIINPNLSPETSVGLWVAAVIDLTK